VRLWLWMGAVSLPGEAAFSVCGATLPGVVPEDGSVCRAAALPCAESVSRHSPPAMMSIPPQSVVTRPTPGSGASGVPLSLRTTAEPFTLTDAEDGFSDRLIKMAVEPECSTSSAIAGSPCTAIIVSSKKPKVLRPQLEQSAAGSACPDATCQKASADLAALLGCEPGGAGSVLDRCHGAVAGKSGRFDPGQTVSAVPVGRFDPGLTVSAMPMDGSGPPHRGSTRPNKSE
jgi:hypothetical protein